MRIFLAIIILLFSFKAEAFSIIRDDEIESYIKEVSTPLLQAAGLSPNSVNFYIINSPELNAFVAGGQNIFLNTGLILEDTDPSMLIGVIAHEIGHISAGHLVRLKDKSFDATITNILGYIVGVGLMAAAGGSGSADAGIAIATASNQVARRNLLKHNRTYESSADQAALKYLKSAGYSAKGILSLMKKLDTNMDAVLDVGNISRYDLTHPITDDRIEVMKTFIKENPHLRAEQKYKSKFNRVVAKLEAFLHSTASNKYDNFSQTYAAAIISHNKGDIKTALKQLNYLEKTNPNDIHLTELKGQILFENGYIKDAVKAYEKASALSYGSKDLIELGLAKAYTNAGNYSKANAILKRITRENKTLPDAWQYLSISEGRSGNLAGSYYALAELYSLRKNKERANEYIKLARKNIKDKYSPLSLKLDDLETSLK